MNVHYKELKIVWGKYIVSLDCVFLCETNEENRDTRTESIECLRSCY